MIGATSQGFPTGSSLTRVLRGLALGGLVALAAWLLVRLILSVVAPDSLYEPIVMAEPAAINPVASIRGYDFSQNPFAAGDPVDVVPVAAVDIGDDAPETTLNLELKGLRSGDNGVAFIRTPDGQEDNIYIGETVMPNVVLRGVFPDYVLIDVNGQTQRLTTEDAKAARNSSGRASTTTRGSASSPSLQTLRAPDANSLLSQISLKPALDQSGRRVGVTLSARSAGVDLSSYGLRNGDVVTRFAGQSLSSGLPDVAALRQATSGGRSVSLNILRDGQPMTITIGSAS